jgi:drug/metabolite transporter (DMT)-like permease
LDTKAIPHIVILGSIYGTVIVASRFGVDQFHPISYIALRFSIACIAFTMIYALRIRGNSFPRGRKLWSLSIVMGVFGTLIPMVLLVSSLLYQSSGVTSILVTASPAVTVLMAHFALDDERLTLRKSAGVALALSGAVFLAVSGESGLPEMSAASPIGYIMVFGAVLIGSIMTIFARSRMREMDLVAVSAIRSFTVLAITLPLMFFWVRPDFTAVQPVGWVAVVFAAILGTFIGVLLDFSILQRFGATTLAMTVYIAPIIAGIGGVWLLGETVTIKLLVGMALIIAGVWLINTSRRKVRFFMRPKV